MNTRRALWSTVIGILTIVAVSLVAVGLVIDRRERGGDTLTAAEVDEATAANSAVLADSGIDLTPGTTTTSVVPVEPSPSTTIKPKTAQEQATTTELATTTTAAPTTTTAPAPTTTVFSPTLAPPGSTPFGTVVGALAIPGILSVDSIAITNADVYANHGYDALKGGAALFESRGWTCPGGENDAGVCYPPPEGQPLVQYTNDIGPLGGHTMAIGAHYSTPSNDPRANKPFAGLRQVNAETVAVIESLGPDQQAASGIGKFTYHAVPCDEQGNYVCEMDVDDLLPTFAAYESVVPTVFFFTCDGRGDMRMFTKFERVVAEPPQI